MITGFDAAHALTDLDNDARSLVSEHHREQPFGIIAA
jgi:hypothetical protein